MNRICRRDFLRVSAVISAGTVIGACQPVITPAAEPTGAPPAQQPTAPPAGQPTTVPEAVTKYSEAPALAERVGKGELPPVEERLSPNPQVIEPIEEVGQYGGTVHIAIGNANALFGDPQGVMGTEGVLRIARDFNSITGGLFESWEFNEDATEQVLHMRKGLLWSDGEPFTTQDCLFAWEDWCLNEELSPAGPPATWCTGAGTDKVPMKMTAVDDYTLALEFTAPYPLIINEQAFYAGCQNGIWAPKHYGQQFHPKYAPKEELDKLVPEAQFENWTQLFGDKMRVASTIPAAIGLPGMMAYIRTADDPDHHTYEPNPYYWKVDTAGNQLPYFDKVIVYIVPDKELLTAKLLAGDLDFVGHSTYLKDMELYKKEEQDGKVKVYLWDSVLIAAVIIYPNLTAKDAELRDLFQRKNVRAALSLAINRDEINDVVHFGLGEPRQVAPWPNSVYYREGDELHYAEYDPDRANQLLDEEGFTERDAEGYRLFPSGKRIGWVGEFDSEQGDIAPTLELCIQYWKEIGIEFSIKPINRQLLSERGIANELPMTFWQGDIGSDIVFPTAGKILYGAGEWGNALGWGRAWEAYMTRRGEFPGLEEEPPDWVKAMYADKEELVITVDEQQRVAIMRRMLDRFYEYLPCFGTVGVPQAIVMKPNFSNFPKEGVWGFATIRAVPANPEQFFYKQA